MSRTRGTVLVTCEHADHQVPRPYRHLFRSAGRVLQSHRGWDPGSLDLGRAIARRLGAPLVVSRWTRLLVDLNRSRRHRDLFSEWTRPLPRTIREELIAEYWEPHRHEVVDALDSFGPERVAMHLGIHTFTPVRRGVRRACDVGVLYDPSRAGECDLASRLIDAVRTERERFVVRRNYPYRGVADGLISSLRRERDPTRYVGIELEVNQRHVRRASQAWSSIVESIAGAVEIACAELRASTS